MKRTLTFSLLILFALISKSQVQFAGTGKGGVYTVNTNGNVGLLHTYPEINEPISSFIHDNNGKLYFTVNGKIATMNSDGSAYAIIATLPSYVQAMLLGDNGKIFVSTLSGKLYMLNTDGSQITYLADVPPCGTLIMDNDNWIYGMGSNSPTVLFRIKTNGTNYGILHTFTDAEGISRVAKVCLTPNNRLFGAFSSAAGSNGTIFSIDKGGSDFKIHHKFDIMTDGYRPFEEPAYQNGKVFFVTIGGAYNQGTICSIDTAGNNFSKIYDFNGASAGGGLKAGNNGKLYGGTNTNPLVYSISENGQIFSIVHQADAASLHYYGTPSSFLLVNNNSTLTFYSSVNGLYSGGFLYSVNLNGQNAHTVYDWGSSPGGVPPLNGLIKDSSSHLFGVTSAGGSGGGGTIFTQNEDGTGYNILYHFTGTQARFPNGKLLLASDGKLYGVCKYGGNPTNIYKGGAIYKINIDGTGFTIIKSFTGSGSDYSPTGNLTEGPTGVLYGMTDGNFSSTQNPATIFKINKDGSGYAVLKTLDLPTEGNLPKDGLLFYSNYLYGTCSLGGAGSAGTLFRLRPDGSDFSVLKTFQLFGSSSADGSPAAGLTASNGRIYGTTTRYYGTIFSILPNGADFLVHKVFDYLSEGNETRGRLVQATDGKLYGATSSGGPGFSGVLYRINTNGTNFEIVVPFDQRKIFSSGDIVEIPYKAVNDTNSVIFCPPNATTSLISNVTGGSYQWKVDTGNGFNNISNNAIYNNVGSRTLQINSISSAANGYKFQCISDGATSNVFVLKFNNSWVGNLNDKWETPANWSCGVLPDENTDVVINTGSGFPSAGIISVNSNVTIRSLKVNPGVIVTVKNGFQLVVSH